MDNSQFTIFIIDDEPAITKMLSFRLKVNGYNVVVAHNGVEAIQELKKTPPDLIILDLNMPQMGGVEFYNEICDEHSNPRYPVFIFTAQTQMEQFFDDFQIAGFITKPYDFDKLLNDIQSVLGQNAALKELAAKKEGTLIGIAENDKETLSLLVGLFEKSGYKTISCETATLFIVESLKNPPDISIIKYDLKDIKGDQLIRKLHQIRKNPDAKYVLFSKNEPEEMDTIKEKIGNIPGLTFVFSYKSEEDLLKIINKQCEC